MEIYNSRLIAYVAVEVPKGRHSYVLDILDAWANKVATMAIEAEAPLGTMPDPRDADDLIDALDTRDRLDQALRMIDGDVELGTLKAADELFRRFTVFDETQTLQRGYPYALVEPWWWRRVPTAGPNFEELRADWGYQPTDASE